MNQLRCLECVVMGAKKQIHPRTSVPHLRLTSVPGENGLVRRALFRGTHGTMCPFGCSFVTDFEAVFKVCKLIHMQKKEAKHSKILVGFSHKSWFLHDV